MKSNHTKIKIRQVYNPPKLIVYGDIRDITLGGSPGAGDTGGGPQKAIGQLG